MRIKAGYILALGLLLVSCNKKTSVDGEGFFGRRPMSFFHVDSPSSATIVTVESDRSRAMKYIFNADTGLANLGAVDIAQIIFSSDGKILTIKGDSHVFEHRELAPNELTPASLASIPNGLDTFCANFPQNSVIGSTDYTEVQIKNENGKFSLYAVGPNAISSLGSASRTDSPMETVYEVASFGNFKIDLTTPLVGDSQYFKTTVTNSAWFSNSGLYCHLNRSEVIIAPAPNYSVSSTATNAMNVGSESSWIAALNAVANNGSVAVWGPDQSSNILRLTGYFRNAQNSIPLTASIDGIKVNCFAQGTKSAYSTVQLLKLANPVGQNKGNQSLLPSQLSLSGDFGGASDLWGTTWTAADINDPGFGVDFGVDGTTGHGTAVVDYCEIRVYWQ